MNRTSYMKKIRPFQAVAGAIKRKIKQDRGDESKTRRQGSVRVVRSQALRKKKWLLSWDPELATPDSQENRIQDRVKRKAKGLGAQTSRQWQCGEKKMWKVQREEKWSGSRSLSQGQQFGENFKQENDLTGLTVLDTLAIQVKNTWGESQGWSPEAIEKIFCNLPAKGEWWLGPDGTQRQALLPPF